MILASATPLTLTLALASAGAYAVSAIGPVRLGPRAVRTAIWLAWLLHGVLLGWSLFGEQPLFGFAPALSMTAWLVAAAYAVESHVYPLLKTRWTLSVLGTGAVLLSVVFPGSPLHANASPWLPFHWAVGIASYGMFGVAVVHAWMMSRAEDQLRLATDPHSGMPLLTMERLTFRFVGAGFVLLTVTLVAGLLFDKQLYGGVALTYWNHKTIFSLLSWLTFAMLLVGRAQFGWRGRRAVRFLYAGSGLLLMAYVGSRFVMEVILGKTV